MDIAQSWFNLRQEQKNEEACQLLAPDAEFVTPKETANGVANILAFLNANPTPKVRNLTLFLGAACSHASAMSSPIEEFTE